MAFSENEPTEVSHAPKGVDYKMVEDFALYEVARPQYIINDHIDYAREIANKFRNGLPIELVIEMAKYSIVKDHMDNVLIAQYLNEFLAKQLGPQQFNQYMELEDKAEF